MTLRIYRRLISVSEEDVGSYLYGKQVLTVLLSVHNNKYEKTIMSISEAHSGT